MATNDATNSIYITPAGGTLTGNIAFNPSTNGILAATNNDPDAGIVGQRISSTVVAGSAVSLVNNTAKTVTSITLTAGDWDVRGNIWYIAGATTVINEYFAGLSTADNTLPSEVANWSLVNIVMTTGTNGGINALTQRFNVSSNTTVYLIAFSSFNTSTMTACGRISAVRQR